MINEPLKIVVVEQHPRVLGVRYPYRFQHEAGGRGTLRANAEIIELIYWCREQFGPADHLEDRPWNGKGWRWRADFSGMIELADATDAAAFKVRWC